MAQALWVVRVAEHPAEFPGSTIRIGAYLARRSDESGLVDASASAIRSITEALGVGYSTAERALTQLHEAALIEWQKARPKDRFTGASNRVRILLTPPSA